MTPGNSLCSFFYLLRGCCTAREIKLKDAYKWPLCETGSFPFSVSLNLSFIDKETLVVCHDGIV